MNLIHSRPADADREPSAGPGDEPRPGADTTLILSRGGENLAGAFGAAESGRGSMDCRSVVGGSVPR